MFHASFRLVQFQRDRLAELRTGYVQSPLEVPPGRSGLHEHYDSGQVIPQLRVPVLRREPLMMLVFPASSRLRVLMKVRAKNVERVGSRDKQGPMFGNFDRFLMRIESKLNDTRYDFLLKPTSRNSSASLSARYCFEILSGLALRKLPLQSLT